MRDRAAINLYVNSVFFALSRLVLPSLVTFFSSFFPYRRPIVIPHKREMAVHHFHLDVIIYIHNLSENQHV